MKIVIDLSGIKEYIRYLTIALPTGIWIYRNIILFIKGKALQKARENIEDYNIFYYMYEIGNSSIDSVIICIDLIVVTFGTIGLIALIISWAWS